MSDTYNVNSVGQVGGITAGQVNIGRPQRVLDETSQKTLLQRARSCVQRGKRLLINAPLGDAEAYRFASEIKDLLTAQGYAVDGVNQDVWVGPPVTGAKVVEHDDALKITIGHQ